MSFEAADAGQSIRFSNDIRDDLYQNSLQQGPQPIPPKSQQQSFFNFGEVQQQSFPPQQLQQPVFQGAQQPVFQGGQQPSFQGAQQQPSFQGAPQSGFQGGQQSSFQGPQQPAFQGSQPLPVNRPSFQGAPSFGQQQQPQMYNPQSAFQQYAPQFPPQGGNFGFNVNGPQQPLRVQRPGFIMYQPNIPRPQQIPLQPNGPTGGDGGGLVNSLQNFITNIGQGAVGLLNPAPVGAPPGYRPSFPGQQNAPQVGRPPGAQPQPNNPIGQFARAVEEITRNDDYQCIPKIICQMVGSQRRLPPIFGSPIFSA